MKFLNVLALATFAAAAQPTVYLIRHGEKPADDGNGLSAAGVQRSQCLRNVFGASSSYNIGHIMAQTPKSSEFCLNALPLPLEMNRANPVFIVLGGKRQRPYDTVKPLADDLGMDVDISCDRDDPDCVADVVRNYSGSGNILIW